MKASNQRRKKHAEATSGPPKRANGESLPYVPSLGSLARIMVRPDIRLERPHKPSPEPVARILIGPDIGPDASSDHGAIAQRANAESIAYVPSLESLARIMVRPDSGLEGRPLKPSPESVARIVIGPDIGPVASSGLGRGPIAPSPRVSRWHPVQSLGPLAASISPLVQRLRSIAPAIGVLFQTQRLSLVARVALALSMGTVAYTVYASSHKAHHSVIPVVVSGAPLIRQTPSGAHERWGNTPVTVTLDASLDALDPAAKDAVRSAFGTWLASGIALPRLTFESSAQSRGAVQDGVNLVRYGPITLPGHEQDLAVTIGYEDATTGEILEADTIFNSDYPIAALLGHSSEKAEGDSSQGCDDRYDLENVAAHEAGHFFGLGEDAEDTLATMYFRSLPCQTHKRVLTDSDRAVMTTLYAERFPDAAHGCGGTAAPAPSSTRSTPSSAR